VLIAVGATAGHVYPALAIAEAYRSAWPDLDVRFAGPPAPLTARVLARHGHELAPVSGSPLVNVRLGAKVAAGARVVAGVAQARRVLRAHRTRLVLGLGGYASGAILLAARWLGARVAIHEPNVVPGLANRWLAALAQRIYLGFDGDTFAGRPRLVTGHPVRADVAVLAHERRTAPPAGRAAHVLVLSSTRGERFFAEQVPALLAAVARQGRSVEVLHPASQLAVADLADAYRRAGVRATVTPYLDEIAGAYRWADLVVTRAGAGALAETAAAGLPALLVPLGDASHDHQAANAQTVAATGAAIVVREREWQGHGLASRLVTLLADPAWTAAATAARALARPDAAARIVADCEALMVGRW
jgi:UDP-N-acetylglucosamine--N-acetylmuramyl-(pentapeptide) pyrophosphoryl-undecaprenol N-acetylglucosamine transferase